MAQIQTLLTKLADNALDKEQLARVLDVLRATASNQQQYQQQQQQHQQQQDLEGLVGDQELWLHSESLLSFIQTRAILHQELLEKAIELLHGLIVTSRHSFHKRLQSQSQSLSLNKSLKRSRRPCDDDGTSATVTTASNTTTAPPPPFNPQRARQVFRQSVAVCLYKSVTSKRRNRILKMALEMLRVLCSSSSEHKYDANVFHLSQPTTIVATSATVSTSDPTTRSSSLMATEEVPLLLRILDNVEEDVQVLLLTMQTLRSCVQGNESCARFAIEQKAIPVLSRVLMTSSHLETRVCLCHVLIAICESAVNVSAMFDVHGPSKALIQALTSGLSGRPAAASPPPGPKDSSGQVEFLLLQVLQRLLALNPPLHEQLIHEGMIEVLFDVVQQNLSVIEVTRAACGVLEQLSRFAKGNQAIDLVPFLVPLGCDPLLLITACGNSTPCNALRTDLVLSVFHFFVNITDTNHLSDSLPAFANTSIMEGLLSLYMASGTSGKLTQLADLLVKYVINLPRSSLDQLTLENEDRTLPSLFLLVRNYSDRLLFIAQVYAMLSKYWKLQAARNRSVQLVSGFVSTAVTIVNRVAITDTALKEEMMDVYNFLRLVVSSREGCELVRGCGGKTLTRSMELLTKMPRNFECGEMAQVLSILDQSLQQDFASSRVGEQGVQFLVHNEDLKQQGDTAYEAFAARLMCHEGVLTRARKQEEDSQANESHGRAPRVEPHLDLTNQSEVNQESNTRDLCVPIDSQNETEAKLQAELLLLTSRRDRSTAVQEHPRREELNDEEFVGHELDDLDLVVVMTDEPSPEQQQQQQQEQQEDEDEDEDEEGIDDGVHSEEQAGEIPRNKEPDETLDVPPESEQQEFIGEGDQHKDLDEVQAGFDGIGLSEQGGPTSGLILSQPALGSDSIVQSFVNFEWYFQDPTTKTKHPKHPLKYPQNNNQQQLLLMDAPDFLEPCEIMNADQMGEFIQESSTRRSLFLQHDATRRAKIVYENLKVFGYDPATANGQPQQDGETPNPAGLAACSSASCLVPPPMFANGTYPYDIDLAIQATDEYIAPSLTFDSMFESGNLQCAIRIGEREYDLILRRDVNTLGHHIQWFYFAISNISAAPQRENEHTSGCVDTRLASGEYRFNIVNLCKPDSLFNQGLQPVIYSVKNATLKKIGWTRAGTNVCYFANPFNRPGRNRTGASLGSSGSASNLMESTGEAKTPTSVESTYFTLSFTLQFEHLDDTVLIAHSYPYTLTDHRLHLEKIVHTLTQNGTKTQKILRKKTLCWTQSGRECEILTITDFGASVTEVNMRRSIIFTGRVHPGEPQASWVMRGLLDFLVSDSEEAKLLRRLFVFRVVPMLNPDGVFLGNSRCGLSACDLNRQWGAPCSQLHPTILATKQMIFQEFEKRGIVFFCDFHGHSRKKNVFLYGCDTKKKPNPKARLFAKEFASQAKKFVSYDDCSFRVSKDKEKTARVVLANELKLAWSFTLEASFCGPSLGELHNFHFNTSHFQQVGPALCNTLLEACIMNVEVRERALALVGNRRFCLPAYIEPSLRELGLICGGGLGTNSSTSGSANTSGSASTANGNGLIVSMGSNSNSFKRGDDAPMAIPSRKSTSNPKKIMKKKKPKADVKEETIQKTRLVKRATASGNNLTLGKVPTGNLTKSNDPTSPKTKSGFKKLPRRRTKTLEEVVQETLVASPAIKAVPKTPEAATTSKSEVTTHLPPCGLEERGSTNPVGRTRAGSNRMSAAAMDAQTDSQVVDDAIHLAKMLNSLEAKALRRAFSPAPSVYYSYEFPSGPMPTILPATASELTDLQRSKLRSAKEPQQARIKGTNRQLTGWNTPLKSSGLSFRELMKAEPAPQQPTYQRDLINAVSMPIGPRSTTARATLNSSTTRPPKLEALASSSSRCLPTVQLGVNSDPPK